MSVVSCVFLDEMDEDQAQPRRPSVGPRLRRRSVESSFCDRFIDQPLGSFDGSTPQLDQVDRIIAAAAVPFPVRVAQGSGQSAPCSQRDVQSSSTYATCLRSPPSVIVVGGIVAHPGGAESAGLPFQSVSLEVEEPDQGCGFGSVKRGFLPIVFIGFGHLYRFPRCPC